VRYLITLLLSIFGIFSFASVFADQIPISAFQKCCGTKLCVEYPVRNSTLSVANATDQFFLKTDQNGTFYLENTPANKLLMAYLATEDDTIYAGCHSQFTNSNQHKITLEGLCPADNCKII
jgi:hypothetical protein